MTTESDAIRAEIVGRRITQRLRKRDKSWVHWHMTIRDGETVILTDDCRSLTKLHDEATRHVEAFRRLRALGHTFRPWSELVEEAGD